jgi:hypothetical protein
LGSVGQVPGLKGFRPSVLFRLAKNQTETGSDFWNLVWNQNQGFDIFKALKPNQNQDFGLGFRVYPSPKKIRVGFKNPKKPELDPRLKTGKLHFSCFQMVVIPYAMCKLAQFTTTKNGAFLSFIKLLLLLDQVL